MSSLPCKLDHTHPGRGTSKAILFHVSTDGKALVKVYATVDGPLDQPLWFKSVSSASNYCSVAASQTSSTNGNIWWWKKGGQVGAAAAA